VTLRKVCSSIFERTLLKGGSNGICMVISVVFVDITSVGEEYNY
jgi:hypothetical protein